MPAKTPMYLKTSTPKRGKKMRLRDVLSSDMISPPLGDFRHSAHIGKDGESDMFGDISFLQGKYDVLPNLNQKPTSQSTGQGLDEEYNYERGFNNGAGDYPTLLKNAVSLPAFGGTHKSQDQEQAPPKPPRLHLEEGTGQRALSVSCTTECFHSAEEVFAIPTFNKTGSSVSLLAESNTSSECSVIGNEQLDGKRALIFNSEMSLNNETLFPSNTYLSGSESSLGLNLDLGPSILDDVLRIMDGYKI
ncbi:cdc42 effector protein 2 [Chiloscyllium plagiosum]|uniref:cdc42 effector protein 2 n=1 Tax=Chiloscyllium plagiosum TaxID=36176 RepID=UPI001CB87ABC|nr:cdc42 effector protein 2 [Chiloscyllium plagiosum]XP_043536945.1 cdc42 effector protein 2 [Chiloscyllium plagiosum]XP_043536946.1 cdc42 effector protein 2 [Chiloscyllium plagiosum]XP_043536947.1 cdc42 effector protein 2 [Chiloscyllium plagiosum]XP_043536948.1 cdc42 effector protein 2 [Chiloscyllium plagiosum]XP_043536949.1 cdc42 effector protein 2 [Chiloscyllium plagiosum]